MVDINGLFKKHYRLSIEKTKELRRNKNALMFLLFIFLSTCFWVINALSKDDYTASLTYPVRYTNSRNNELIKGDLDRELTIKVRAGGFSILSYQVKNRSAFEIDISQEQRIKIGDKHGAIVATRDYIRDLTGYLANDMELIEITPDTLFIPLIEKVSKKVPVNLSANLKFEKQMQLSGNIAVQPDSVVVSGPEDLIDTLRGVYTKRVLFEKLKDTLVRNIAIEELDQVEISESRVVVSVPVEPFTEVSVKVPIMASNLADSLMLKSFPSEVKVSYRIGLSRAVHSTVDFSAVVDFAELSMSNMPPRLKVKLNKQPEDISFVTYSPVFIEYLLEKQSNPK